MNFNSCKYVYLNGEAPAQNAFFPDVGSAKSHVCVTVRMASATNECTFGIVALDSKRREIPSTAFESFSSVVQNCRYEMVACDIKGHTVLLGPTVTGARVGTFCFRPSAKLHGEVLSLRIFCFENGRPIAQCKSDLLKIAFPSQVSEVFVSKETRSVKRNGCLWENVSLSKAAPVPEVNLQRENSELRRENALLKKRMEELEASCQTMLNPLPLCELDDDAILDDCQWHFGTDPALQCLDEIFDGPELFW